MISIKNNSSVGYYNKIYSQAWAFIIMSILFLVSCGHAQPVPVKLNVDNCDHCKMTIADTKFAAELITKKGRIYKFDDIICMIDFAKTFDQIKDAKYFVTDFKSTDKFIEAPNAFYIKGGNLKSPMGGNIAAFIKKEDAAANASKLGASTTTWAAITK